MQQLGPAQAHHVARPSDGGEQELLVGREVAPDLGKRQMYHLGHQQQGGKADRGLSDPPLTHSPAPCCWSMSAIPPRTFASGPAPTASIEFLH